MPEQERIPDSRSICCPPGSPRSFAQSCLLAPSRSWCGEGAAPQVQDFTLPSLKRTRLLSAHLSGLAGFLWIAAPDFILELAEGIFCAAVQAIKVLPVNKTNDISLQDNNGYSTGPNFVHSICTSSYLSFI